MVRVLVHHTLCGERYRESAVGTGFRQNIASRSFLKVAGMLEGLEEFVTAVQTAWEERTFISLVISSPAKGDPDLPRRQGARPVVIRGEEMLQWELQFSRLQSHLNLPLADSLARLQELLKSDYRNAHLFTTERDLVGNRKGTEFRVRAHPPSKTKAEADTRHNHQKEYLIPDGIPCPFLVELGVMSRDGRVKAAHQKKFRQINRYLEIVNDVYPQLPESGTLHVVDFGCGLSYLTFALHHLLTKIHSRDVLLLGIDRNEHVIGRCRTICRDLNLQGLQFESRTIDSSTRAERVDLAVSLHACDTATDHALAYAVSAGAAVILAAPCCQHELMTQVNPEPLRPFLKHGVLKERFSALATDALRGCALEAAGYRTQVMEFIDLEHTPKNLLIRAVRRTPAKGEDESIRETKRSEYLALKEFLGASALAVDGILAAAQQQPV